MRRALSLTLLAFVCLAAARAVSAEAPAGRVLVALHPGFPAAQRIPDLERAGLAVDTELAELGILVGTRRFGAMTPGVPLLTALPGVAGVFEDEYEIWIDANGRPAAVFGEARAATLADTALPNLGTFMEKARVSGWNAAPAVPFPLPSPIGRGTKAEGVAGSVSDVEFPWGIRRLRVPEAVQLGMGDGRGVKVAVIDTGIDAAHPELAAAVAGGYNAGSGSRDAWRDENGHGTHVSGTIAAARDGKGVAGVAPGVRLYAVKVLDQDGGGRLTDILKGIVWCAKNGISVANMSLGSPRGVIFMKWAVEFAAARGVTIVAAAGNSGGEVGYPAAYADAIAVSALAAPVEVLPETITAWSSRGKAVAFIAPGEKIPSTVPGGGYTMKDGTSMATPHVTGLAALAVSRGARGPKAVRAALTSAAVPVPGLTAEQQGAGVIDARKLLAGRR